MKVATFINGSLISENSAYYASMFAKSIKTKLFVIHIEENYNSEEIEKCYENISNYALQIGVETEFKIFKNFKQFVLFASKENITQLFTSTKHRHSFFESSFAKKIISLDIKADIAVVKIVQIGNVKNIEKIILPIKNSNLSAKKFAFFLALNHQNRSKGEIYSIQKISRNELAFLDESIKRRKIKDLLFALRYCMVITKTFDCNIHIKHDFTLEEEADKINHHIIKWGYDLAIVGGYDVSPYFKPHPINILFQKPIVNTIYFIAK